MWFTLASIASSFANEEAVNSLKPILRDESWTLMMIKECENRARVHQAKYLHHTLEETANKTLQP